MGASYGGIIWGHHMIPYDAPPMRVHPLCLIGSQHRRATAAIRRRERRQSARRPDDPARSAGSRSPAVPVALHTRAHHRGLMHGPMHRCALLKQRRLARRYAAVPRCTVYRQLYRALSHAQSVLIACTHISRMPTNTVIVVHLCKQGHERSTACKMTSPSPRHPS